MGAPLVVVSRPQDRLQDAEDALRKRGLEPVAAPLLALLEVDGDAFAQFVREVRDGLVDVVVFTSQRGPDFAAALAARHGLPPFAECLADVLVAAVGPRTADAAVAVGLDVDVVAPVHTSDGLADALGGLVPGRRVVLLRSTEGSPILTERLQGSGASVLDVPVYTLARPPAGPAHEAVVDAVRQGRVAAYAFTSAMTVAHFFDLMEEFDVVEAARASLEKAVVTAIGPPTADALHSFGVDDVVVAPTASFDVLADTVASSLGVGVR